MGSLERSPFIAQDTGRERETHSIGGKYVNLDKRVHAVVLTSQTSAHITEQLLVLEHVQKAVTVSLYCLEYRSRRGEATVCLEIMPMHGHEKINLFARARDGRALFYLSLRRDDNNSRGNCVYNVRHKKSFGIYIPGFIYNQKIIS